MKTVEPNNKIEVSVKLKAFKEKSKQQNGF